MYIYYERIGINLFKGIILLLEGYIYLLFFIFILEELFCNVFGYIWNVFLLFCYKIYMGSNVY